MNVLADDPLTLAYHELRSPLGLLVMSAHAIADDAPDPVIRARVAVMARAAERLLRTASHVFEFARAGALDEPVPFVPARCVRDVAADLRALAVDIQVTVAPAAETLSLVSHQAAFEAIVQSLVNNAIEHGAPGQPVELRLVCEDGRLTFAVANAISDRPRGRGLGVGLHLCRRLATHLDAILETESRGGCHSARLIVPTRQDTVSGF